MSVKFSNNAVTSLTDSPLAGATFFNVASASPFPTLASGDWTYVSLTSEVVKVTAISGTTFTCDATSAAHASGESVELRMTAELLNDFAEDTEALPLTGGTMTGTIAGFTSTGIDDNATSTKLTISDTTITGVGAFTSTSIDATKLSGALPAIDGSNLTGIEAVIKQTTKPTGQSVGTFWFDTDDKILHIHDGSDFVQVYETSNNGTSALPFTSAWESKQLGAANGNYYVMINGTKRHVYINNSDYDGAWILVTRVKSNSNAHHGGGGSGGDSSPIDPSSSSAPHDYSDSFINEIFAARAYNGSNSGCTWRAYANNRGNMFGYATSANFCSDCQADGSGWDLVNGSYSSSYNVNLGGNSGSRGFGDHHANGSFFAYNRHNSNSGFAHDNMSNSDGVFYIRN